MTLYEASTSSATHSYAVAADKFLLGIEVKSNAGQTINVGTTPGGAEIAGPITLTAGYPWTGQQIAQPSFAGYDIHFSGLSGSNLIKIWLLG